MNRSKSPTTIDLFAGAGGLVEGFRQAGYRCLYANEINQKAAATLRYNHPDTVVEVKPIEEVDAASVLLRLGLKPGELDVLTGGPPCQGFSRNNRSRHPGDSRNGLIWHYLRFVEVMRPAVLVMENVPGLVDATMSEVFCALMDALSALGYHASWRVMKAAEYGVPQRRLRVIILAGRDGPPPVHPSPTHGSLERCALPLLDGGNWDLNASVRSSSTGWPG